MDLGDYMLLLVALIMQIKCWWRMLKSNKTKRGAGLRVKRWNHTSAWSFSSVSLIYQRAEATGVCTNLGQITDQWLGQTKLTRSNKQTNNPSAPELSLLSAMGRRDGRLKGKFNKKKIKKKSFSCFVNIFIKVPVYFRCLKALNSDFFGRTYPLTNFWLCYCT